MVLIGDLYTSHTGLAERAGALVEAAEAAGDRQSADLARLMLADLNNRAGRVPEAVAAARELLDASEDRLVRAHAHAVIGSGLWRIGDNATGARHALRASRMLVAGDPPA